MIAAVSGKFTPTNLDPALYDQAVAAGPLEDIREAVMKRTLERAEALLIGNPGLREVPIYLHGEDQPLMFLRRA